MNKNKPLNCLQCEYLEDDLISCLMGNCLYSDDYDPNFIEDFVDEFYGEEPMTQDFW